MLMSRRGTGKTRKGSRGENKKKYANKIK